ncbi:hypothetical protein [Herpetosiphon geysericola]|uniref:Uncharacterized protein n=1 Tax=Herpetosiphon geysericola TaxID=70996 RepID=A0A0P6XJ89_9CHLR|nr:hypothetical protein [Herpetosiphon geysericola]KPL80214.1 hypothetical protein SE18_24470 [Herpetosiphon geysericola]
MIQIILNYGAVQTPLQIGQLDHDEALIIQRQLTKAVRAVFADMEATTCACMPTYHVTQGDQDGENLHP